MTEVESQQESQEEASEEQRLLRIVDDFECIFNAKNIKESRKADGKQKAAGSKGLDAQIKVIAGDILFFTTQDYSNTFYTRLENFSYLKTGDCPLVNIFKHNVNIFNDIFFVFFIVSLSCLFFISDTFFFFYF